MKFTKVEPPKSPRTDYISEDGKIRLIKDESAGISTRYMASINLGSVLVSKFGVTPRLAISELREAALSLAAELVSIVAHCGENNGEITLLETEQHEMD